MGGFLAGSESTKIHPAVLPDEAGGDIVITKTRTGAFSGTELQNVLRALGAEHLVVAGVATSGCVLSTVRVAADMDYKITVLEDLCSDANEEVQKVLMGYVFPKQGKVVSSEEWIKGL